ncbi:MAG: DUF4012 domain-containing protein [Candidatus Gracilibacteria bacterium]|nr:DUF4012 domain-containing protein [Candidatus Gracilibacteria bacterium]
MQRVLDFISRHKILVSSIFIFVFVLFYLIRVILGPFGFMASHSLSLMGFFGDKTYLVLLENENELRPTGGFVTGFAIIKMSHGVPEVHVFDSISVVPPKPQLKAPFYIEQAFSGDEKYKGLLFHDSGYSLDFRLNAERAVDLLKKDPRFFGFDFDAVFSIDLYAIEHLIDMYGSFKIEGEELTGANLFDVLEKNAKDIDLHDEEEWKNRKNFFAPLAKDLVKEIATSPLSYGDFFNLLGEMAEEKHFLMSFKKLSLQKDVEKAGFSGKVPDGDYFHINNMNLGGRKADRFIQREYWSSFYVDHDGVVNERFEIRMHHQGTYNLQSDLYSAYLRIVRPASTELLEGDLELKDGVFGHFYTLEPDEIKTFVYEFKYAADFAFDEIWMLSLIKQAGTIKTPYYVTFRGFADTSFDITTCRKTENITSCELDLLRDQKLSVTRNKDTKAPIMQWASFSGLNKIELRFSEPISAEIFKEDIKVIDLNKINNETNSIKILDGEVEGNSVNLTIEGVSSQQGEFFQVLIPNLKDSYGNIHSKNPFKVTIVQK